MGMMHISDGMFHMISRKFNGTPGTGHSSARPVSPDFSFGKQTFCPDFLGCHTDAAYFQEGPMTPLSLEGRKQRKRGKAVISPF